MKRTLSVLAPLAAILLLSCSSIENSPVFTEDVNLPQSNALAKPATSEESLIDIGIVDPGVGTRAVCGQNTATLNPTMAITLLAPQATTTSNISTFTLSGCIFMFIIIKFNL